MAQRLALGCGVVRHVEAKGVAIALAPARGETTAEARRDDKSQVPAGLSLTRLAAILVESVTSMRRFNLREDFLP
jgi:hypothetical protein